MEKTGTVLRIKNNEAEIVITRDSACGENCAACGICKNAKETTITVKNSIGLKKGDSVKLITDDKSFLLRSAAAYLSLTALLVLGGVLGERLFGDWGAFCTAIIFAAAGLFVLRRFIKKDMNIKVVKMDK